MDGVGTTSPASRRRHAGEARLKSLEGERILRVHDIDVVQEADFAFIATELAVGSTEDELAHRGGLGIRPDRVVTWVRQALSGLDACHVHGFIHRDVKPSNIFLQGAEWAQLGDFGAAGLIDKMGTVGPGGDPLIRAPEMLKGDRVDLRGDIYSMGVTLHRLLTGEWPVEEPGSWPELKRRVTGGDYIDVRVLAPHVSLPLAFIVRKAMSLKPADRYSSAHEMEIDLARLALQSVWQPAAPASDVREWTQIAGPKGATVHRVTVTRNLAGFDIETRRVGGAGTRVLALCKPEVKRAALTARLHRIFKVLDDRI